MNLSIIPKERAAADHLLQARIPLTLIRRLRSEAALRGVPPRDVVIEALEGHLGKPEPTPISSTGH